VRLVLFDFATDEKFAAVSFLRVLGKVG